jgi:type IV secretory pathway TrbD component
MEFLQEAIASRNIVVWIILVVLLILFIKILKSAGKGFVMLLIAVGLVMLLAKVFPGFMEPLVDFVRGGWLGDHRPDRPW